MHLLDANAFMEASRLYYSFRIAPGYWDWLVDRADAGEIGSVEAVLDEIAVGSGDLVTWATSPVLQGFWMPDTAASVDVARDLVAWANHADRPFTQAAVEEFMASADLRLISQAKTIGATVVTRETSDPQCRRRVKIPDAARAIGVACVQPFVVYERLGLTLRK